MKKTVKERFEEYANPEPNTGCWIWAGPDNFDGYGVIFVNGKNVGAHRVSYSIYNGEIPAGLMVCHTCDNRWCVNPSHLFLGTANDNNQDMIKKGRFANRKGEANQHSKLTEDDVLKIRELRKAGMKIKPLSIMYGVCYTHMQRVASKTYWKHI